MIQEGVIKKVAPRCADPEGWTDAINSAILRFKLDMDADNTAAFLAQIAMESREFTTLQENLYYRADTLMKLWPEHFPTQVLADKYEMSPHALADYVYAGRYGNGDEGTGDGYKYRGRGLIMVTFKDNYRRVQQETGMQVIDCPDILCTKQGAALSAVLFWRDNRLQLNDPANADQFATISRRVNGGLTGEPQRLAYFQRARTVLGMTEV